MSLASTGVIDPRVGFFYSRDLLRSKNRDGVANIYIGDRITHPPIFVSMEVTHERDAKTPLQDAAVSRNKIGGWTRLWIVISAFWVVENGGAKIDHSAAG